MLELEGNILPILQISKPELWIRVFGPSSHSDEAGLEAKAPVSNHRDVSLIIPSHFLPGMFLSYFIHLEGKEISSKSIIGFYLQYTSDKFSRVSESQMLE